MGKAISHFSSDSSSGDGPDIHSEESRKQLAKLLMNLFERWDLDTSTQLNLLGLSTTSRSLLTPYKKGEKALPNTRDLFDRAGWLLSIHKSLRLLYPYNDKLRNTWIHRKNTVFNNQVPLDIIIEQGIIGLAKVARLLDFQRGQ